jgi:hypothetical protein
MFVIKSYLSFLLYVLFVASYQNVMEGRRNVINLYNMQCRWLTCQMHKMKHSSSVVVQSVQVLKLHVHV